MSRLIDVYDLIDFLDIGHFRNPSELCFSENDVQNLLLKAPKVDAVPVVHGEWKYYKKQGIAVCSNCSFERKLDDNFGSAISCPNCGALMDLR